MNCRMIRSTILFTFAAIISWNVTAYCDSAPPLRFNTHDHGDPKGSAPVIEPWRAVELDADYGGMWVVTADIDGDGEVEIVSARNVNNNDVHYTSAVVAHNLDGSVLWRWGDSTVGRREWHHDVACQIYDWDGDSWPEIILLTEGALVELDGITGVERRRIPISIDATDCLMFCNLSGKPRATDVIVKNRYQQLWAYNYGGDLLWTVKQPGGYRTSHQPRAFDLDNDGTDEIMAGYSMLNADGTVRWTLSSDKVDLNRGHLDCIRMMRRGETPSEWRFAATYCGALGMACFDGDGVTLWERDGLHYESINIGTVFTDALSPQIMVDIDHVPRGESPVEVYDAEGTLLGRITSNYCRQHKLLDWTGDDTDEIILANARGVFDNTGRRIATFGCDDAGVAMQTGDMDGDSVPDVGIVTSDTFYIFRNVNGRKRDDVSSLGCGVNFTLY